MHTLLQTIKTREECLFWYVLYYKKLHIYVIHCSIRHKCHAHGLIYPIFIIIIIVYTQLVKIYTFVSKHVCTSINSSNWLKVNFNLFYNKDCKLQHIVHVMQSI